MNYFFNENYLNMSFGAPGIDEREEDDYEVFEEDCLYLAKVKKEEELVDNEEE